MQWLIDLIIEAIGIPPTLIDRGDPSLWDYQAFNLVLDGAWHELDLSAIVPEGATAVAINSELAASTIGKLARFRRHGNANFINASYLLTQVAFIPIAGDFIVFVDADRKIDYIASAANITLLNVCVKGWWL